jgi:hypothetical protein
MLGIFVGLRQQALWRLSRAKVDAMITPEMM